MSLLHQGQQAGSHRKSESNTLVNRREKSQSSCPVHVYMSAAGLQMSFRTGVDSPGLVRLLASRARPIDSTLLI